MSDKFDFLFQNKVVALLLQDGDFMSKYGAIVEPNYFTDTVHQELCEMINKYWQKYSAAPSHEVMVEKVIAVKDEDRRASLAMSLQDVLDADLTDAQYYEDEVVAFCKRQSALLGLRQAAKSLKEGDLDAMVPTLERSLMIGQSYDQESMGLQYWQDFGRVEIHSVAPRVPTLMGAYQTGGIDDILHGGLEQGNVACVMIPVGRGKSVWLVNVAGNGILQGYNVAFLSFELSEKTVANRFNVFFSGLKDTDLETMKPDQIEEAVKSPYKDMPVGNLLIKTFPMKSATVRQFEAHLKIVKAKYNWTPDLVCVDYLDIIKAPFQNKDKHEQLEEVAIELKAFAQRNRIPVWTASQVNREGARKNIIQNEDSSASYAKTFALDVIFTAAPKADEETDKRSAKFFCSKNRQGRDQMTVDFDIDFDTMRFNFVPKDESISRVGERLLNDFKKGMRK